MMYGGGPGVSQGQGENLFREEEKRYQLHREHQMRKRNGRLVGGKFVERPTDLSGVLDVREEASVRQWLADGRMQAHDVGTWQHAGAAAPGAATPGSTRGAATRAFTLPAHPGFVLLPGALAPAVQLQLMRSCLEEYPEPPAHTNHTARYGALPRLWSAAQRDLSLCFKLGIDGPAGGRQAAAREPGGAAGSPSRQETGGQQQQRQQGQEQQQQEQQQQGQEQHQQQGQQGQQAEGGEHSGGISVEEAEAERCQHSGGSCQAPRQGQVPCGLGEPHCSVREQRSSWRPLTPRPRGNDSDDGSDDDSDDDSDDARPALDGPPCGGVQGSPRG